MPGIGNGELQFRLSKQKKLQNGCGWGVGCAGSGPVLETVFVVFNTDDVEEEDSDLEQSSHLCCR